MKFFFLSYLLDDRLNNFMTIKLLQVEYKAKIPQRGKKINEPRINKFRRLYGAISN